jgi:hypothetical protein
MLFLQSPYYNPAHDLANTHFEFQMMAIAIFPIYETTLAFVCPLTASVWQDHVTIRLTEMQCQRHFRPV